MLIGLTVLVILGLLINKLKTVLLPFAIGWLLAYLLHPVVLFFQYKLRVRNRVLSILCTVLLLSFITFCIAWFIIPLIGNEIDKFVQLVTSYTQNFHTINLLPEAWQTAIQMYLSQLDIEAVLSDQNIQNILRNAAPKLWSFVNSSLTFILGFVVIFVVFLYFIFISLDYDKINAGFIRAIPAKYRPLAIEIITDMKNGMNKYFRGQALIALINGILFSIGFHIIGLPMGILLGIIMGILNLIPYMQLLGYIPALLLALLQSAETGQSYGSILLWILALAIFVQALQEIFLMPKIMGKATGLNPAIILLALSVWGTLLGLLGMIIALPVTALLVSYYKRFVLKENPLGEEIDSTESEISEDEL
jgi:predicted PurR-regulated permease PerM